MSTVAEVVRTEIAENPAIALDPTVAVTLSNQPCDLSIDRWVPRLIGRKIRAFVDR